MSARLVEFIDLGLSDYKKTWDYQTTLFDESISIKIANRKEENPDKHQVTKNYLIFCEHPHVYTLGKSGSEANLLVNETILKQQDAEYYKINRGGDITYHGPGQLVAYPIFDLETYFFTDIHKYMRALEEAVILTIGEYGLKGERVDGLTGVWLAGGTVDARKICAMGVKSSRWVTMHGLALNVDTDMSYFNNIVPCGIEDKSVTSLSKELGRKVPMDEVKEKLKVNLANVFDYDYYEE
ncbi:lipoyl(octanoyl) transferase LipB [Parvicella tangerina]|uniref:Octanoyltransferase n=1 Tax=Parvicella tangerina TaxID=2829795 RepID=A0A916NJR0_9FLAO|nr:lipoyl(octanoyl) transferase LipB [Parvicella tangerina]CAG5086461.1 Octanoyltransferase [Parvicella tangerina]